MTEKRWEPEILSGMTTEAIEIKMKELVPGFDLNEFVTKTSRYISCEDLADEEYYPYAFFSDIIDEDFLWIACEELWKRLVPNRPPVELVAEQLDNIVKEIMNTEERRIWKEALRQSQKALDLICQHTIEVGPAGRRLRHDFYRKLREATFYSFDIFFDDIIRNLIGHEEYESVIDIAGIFGDGLGDDNLLVYKAQCLYALASIMKRRTYTVTSSAVILTTPGFSCVLVIAISPTVKRISLWPKTTISKH